MRFAQLLRGGPCTTPMPGRIFAALAGRFIMRGATAGVIGGCRGISIAVNGRPRTFGAAMGWSARGSGCVLWANGMTSPRRSMPTRPRVLADFEGGWTIARDIRPDAGPSARFEGQGVWSPGARGLSYVETGTLVMAGTAPMRAERRYHWTGDLSVFFEDGRFFHKVPATGGETHHWCDPDRYHVRYDFSDWPRFAVIWRVDGPRKSYVMTSRFTRLAGR
mmetsp:Transcript_2571/g.4365  ORF Transcript_2571/g.4365 Transcript_2571/m.4365 type:complete len:220 (+) Transcript_2571:108-767(+)